ncbi:hypothetical protein M3G03_06005 [Aestuariimicrobium sp. p3-SID1156]|uniref:aldose epimerase family protein n=1 Tax=Aestuariimicrobium sp. p3-SID1156 TaxID=2916038 RepID=UPI00223B5319|nr:hypothetical protein [Aestuariimicrobium sp. p3-SID1156]MCT1459095.1 hypothetical protein [Aestuariimicrobium sp. p3-SID1156]
MDDSAVAEWTISSEPLSATLTRRGAFIRSLRHGDREILSSFEPGTTPIMMDGAQLLPWPGRIANGRYDWQGTVQELPITEPERHNAIHGLAHRLDWELVDHSTDRLALGVHLEPQPGWPGDVRVSLTATLDERTLTIVVEVENVGAEEIPFGYGAHPYVRLGGAPRAEWEVEAPFADVLLVDHDRLLPLELGRVDDPGNPLPDLRIRQHLGHTHLDHAFTAPGEHPWKVRVSHQDMAVTISSPDMDWVQLYTPKDASLLAIEPMSVGADAFNGGPGAKGLRHLAPGQRTDFSWSLTVEG